MIKYHFQAPVWRSAIREFYPILVAFNRRRELARLEAWAARKKLRGPLALYQSHLMDEERRLLRYALASPHLFQLARLLFHLNCLMSPQPRFLRKGLASFYKVECYLTCDSKSYSIRVD